MNSDQVNRVIELHKAGVLTGEQAIELVERIVVKSEPVEPRPVVKRRQLKGKHVITSDEVLFEVAGKPLTTRELVEKFISIYPDVTKPRMNSRIRVHLHALKKSKKAEQRNHFWYPIK